MPEPFPSPDRTFNRRHLLSVLASAGLGTAAFQRALAAQASQRKVTAEMIAEAAWIAGLELTEQEQSQAVKEVAQAQHAIARLRAVDLPYEVPPAVRLDLAIGNPDLATSSPESPLRKAKPIKTHPFESDSPPGPVAKGELTHDDLSFHSLAQLSSLIQRGVISSEELTKLYLARLKKYDPSLLCVVTLTPELALKQARQADREIAAGRYRGPLHGIPWGAKDLIAVAGYPTTWGASPFVSQTLEDTATVAKRLEAAGAVLVAKLSLGTLASGDEWFGGRTRNPWNPRQGSSGSSAGSAAATVAGLVGFSLGSETLGSITSPSRRCGASGLRPTFGRVSRHGCMSLAWSFDKIGPIARSAEDCALVFDAIHGADSSDATTVNQPFHWPPRRDLREITVGYFENKRELPNRPELNVLRDLGVRLKPFHLPRDLPTWSLSWLVNVEAASAFEDLTRQGVQEGLNSWPAAFHQAHFVSAVDYLRAQRVRTLLMRAMAEQMKAVDMYVDTEFRDLMVTNLTGHPCIAIPNGFQGEGTERTPTSIGFTGQLYGESDLLAVAHAYQEATGFHLERPKLDG